MYTYVISTLSITSSTYAQALVKLRETMELIAEQDWVREQCSKQDSRQLLDTDKLGDASLSPAQVRGLIPFLSSLALSLFLL